jgi:nitrogen-specific signal transduction histidine kinase
MNSDISKKLRILNEIGKELTNCETWNELIRAALKQVRENLDSQVSSIFLLDKNKILTREGIDGIDFENKPIPQDWFPEEKYKPGESFSGKAVPEIGSNDKFGSPYYSNDLKREKMKNEEEYSTILGKLKSGISVPLNGFYQTFGTIEVLNKNGDGSFTDEDIYCLTLISNLVANHISNIRRNHRKKVYNELTEHLFKIESGSDDFNFKKISSYLAENLIAPTTPYKICIIRKVNKQGDFEELVKEATDDINWKHRNPDPIKKDGVNHVSEVYREKEPFYCEDLEGKMTENPDKFYNGVWIKENNLKSIAILPLLAMGGAVGTITVYTGYNHKFLEGNKQFLNNVAYILASIVAITKYKKELMEEKHKLFAVSQQVGHDSMMQDFLHRYKNELIDFSVILSQLSGQSNKSNKFKEQMIYERKQWIEHRVEEIKQEFQGNGQELNLLNINQKVQEITKLFLSDEPDIALEASYNPDIPEIEVKSSEIEAMIYNLINNAIIAVNNAKPKQKRLTIATNLVTISRIDYIEILVQDNGNGIPNEISDQVFKKGFSTRQEQGGTGRGLFIAKDVIDNYGGKISFESKVGQGTMFKVHIPYRQYVP